MLSVLLAIGNLSLFSWLRRKSRQRRKARHKPSKVKLSEFLRGFLATLAVLVSATLGLLLSSIWIGLPAASFPLMSLALLSALGVCAVITLLTMLIVSFFIPASSGRFGRSAKGCALALILLLIVIPAVLFLGGGIVLIFLNLYLGITIGWGLSIAVWLTVSSFLLLGFASLGFILAQ